MPRIFIRLCIAAALASCAREVCAAQSSVPTPDAMANQAEPREFVTRSDIALLAQGNPLRFGGVNLSWLGLHGDTNRAADLRFTTDYEMNDAFATAHAMGVGVVRIASLAAPAGCALCLMPSPGQINPQALAHADHLLRLARDAGMKILVPLAGAAQCEAGAPDDAMNSAPCLLTHARGLPTASFFSDPELREAFVGFVSTLLNHVNPETGRMWKEDPTILAWENCDACGTGSDPQAVAEWSEFVGRAIKATDHFHLYEDGAFAGHVGEVAAERFATPSVDIVGDAVSPPPGGPPDPFTAAREKVNKADCVYVIDSYGWTPKQFATPADFAAFLNAMLLDRNLAGALLSDLGGHADAGGWLKPARADDPPLYFPGTAEAGLDLAASQARARAVRRFAYNMTDLDPPAFLTPDPPQIISVTQGKVVWRGAAGAVDYSIARSTDLTQIGSWDMLCDHCVTDADPHWQDALVPKGNVWYRMTPFNANMHGGIPSEPVKNEEK